MRGYDPGLMSDRLPSIRATLETHGQAHLLAFYDDLSESEQAQLLEQLEHIDFAGLEALIETHVRAGAQSEVPANLQPAPYYPLGEGSTDDAAQYRAAGTDLIRAGKVAALAVAGGQATRLGRNSPKGTYPATVVTGKPLFRVLAEQIVANQNRYRVTIPWYIMTSPTNDAATRAFFRDNNCFGIKRRDIFMFPQGLLPSIDAFSGKLLLSEKGAVAMNPDGHGGCIKALAASGAIHDMVARGIEHISYFQVDNPLVKVIDPQFVGLHAAAADSSAEMSSKMVPKAHPQEKVGVFCRADGKTVVIEYSDLLEQLAQQRDEAGHLRFLAGSIAIHMISVKFVQKLTADPLRQALPYHRAEKTVPFIDPKTGQRAEPTQPNAVKLEMFVFDAIPLAKSSIIYETSRVEEFAPIKNARGEDSPMTSHQLQSDRSGAWLEAHGVKIPRDAEGHVAAKIELGPLTALICDDLAGIDLPAEIQPGAAIVL